jgi:ParB family chromosome partitioning protein
MAIKKGLGKGLDALLMASRSEKSASQSQATQKELATKEAVHKEQHFKKESKFETDTTVEFPIDKLKPGQYQPRRDMVPAALTSLSESIRAQGIIQPIIIRAVKEKNKEDVFEIIAGERRWRAAQMVGLKTVPVIIKSVSDKAAMAMALIENIQREDLNPVEEALALERLVKEFDLTHQEAAETVGKSRVAVSNSLRLLTLTDEVKALLERGELEVGHAKVLLGLRGHEQIKFAERVVQNGLSVRETEKLLAARQEKDLQLNQPTATKPSLDPDIRRLQTLLSDKFGAKVEISHQNNGSGKITIHYHSLDEMDGILEKFN